LIALAIHGGAGTMTRRKMTSALAARYEKGLAQALDAGHGVLAKGGSALDAVCAAVVELEDDALFNAGRGACYNSDEKHELDAAVMDGATRRAGAVGAVSGIRNPVLAARAVMEKSRHVLLIGRGAERFAREQGVRMAPATYFATRSRLLALRRRAVGHHGTVGAVALDADGRLAAATSTGGYTGKLPGRIGDSPLIGAGTYADELCAVSCTGLGEAFIRTAAAHDVSARMRYRRQKLSSASAAALAAIATLGADGGLIAVDRRGNIATPFNSEGMYRGAIDRRGRRSIAIY
jgi:L-asparaginase / beta-aspartyl-peptidase